MHDSTPVPRPSKAMVAAAFAAVCLIWGSTYLAIRVAIDTMPPLLMAGSRFLVAGGVLYAWLRLRGAPKPSRADWGNAGLIGCLLLASNGTVTWGETRIPTGLTAMLIGALPLWITLLAWARDKRAKPTPSALAGLAVGLSGVLLLVGPWDLGGAPIDLLGATIVVVGSLSWATGTVLARGRAMPSPPLLGVAIQMLAGGLLLSTASVALGEPAQLRLDGISDVSALAFVYLVVAGSLVAFSAYVWLLGVLPAGRVATYAFVNPVVALALGAALASEPLTPRTLAASGIILGGVALAQLWGQPRAERARAALRSTVRPRRRRRRMPPFE
jgi:drug/metabolite transporter (DMT)-like permease